MDLLMSFITNNMSQFSMVVNYRVNFRLFHIVKSICGGIWGNFSQNKPQSPYVECNYVNGS